MLYTKEQIDKLTKRWTTKNGREALQILKRKRCYFSPAEFHKSIKNLPGINDPEVENYVDLRGAPLSNFDFRIKNKSGFVDESNVLYNIRFEGAHLRHSNFSEMKIHKCFFDNTDLSHSEMDNTTLNDCTFQEANLGGSNLSYAKLIHCDFTRASIKEVHLGMTIVDQRTSFGKNLRTEIEGNFNFAAIEYKQLRELYRNSSLHSEADNAHYRAMVAKRKSHPQKHPFRWFSFLFGDLLCKYGTSFGRVLIWGAIVIFGCAATYYLNDSLLYQNSNIHVSFSDALYFSISTFSTLGYGDFHAIGNIRFLAGIESLVGLALMSLFTVIVARTIIRE